ncbi:MAG TPA: hypothetical protein VHW44_04090 [Pseudonocardiaceae bacterium]|nr:hypothetical protein [Pseudonocardiaceae bacterium]
MTDPFGTAALRDSVLTAWRDSPTRFREDANAEEDLRLGGYRDRLLVELAQNAADAAVLAGQSGTLRLTLVSTSDGPELRAANTGAPLDTPGVAALASLRASAKRTGHQVGRFGVGFAAVLAASDAPRVVSTSGGVAFSAARTRAAVADDPKTAPLLAERGDEVPVLRLVWPVADTEDPVPDGFVTEVRLPLLPAVDADAVLADLAGQAEDLLLALPGLTSVLVGDEVWSRTDLPDGIVRVDGPAGHSVWLTRRTTGTLAAGLAEGLGVEARERPEWSVSWAVPLTADGAPTHLPGNTDVLHAPTPTDERLSLPARLFATLPIESSRRRLLPGKATDAVLAEAAAGYVELVRALPAEHRPTLVPEPGFPMSEVDGVLRDAVLAGLADRPWLPAAPLPEDAGPEDAGPDAALSDDAGADHAGADDLPAAGAVVLDVPDAELTAALAELQPRLLAWWLAEPRYATALSALGVRRLRPIDVVAAVSGIRREPSWWATLYAALARVTEADPTAAEELSGLPVPLIDGRTVLGPRDVLLPADDLTDLLSDVDIIGLRIAHPDAVHPLLERLGARPADAVDLLAAPAIQEAVTASLADATAGGDPVDLADTVLTLVEAARVDPGELTWLGALALPDEHGEPRRADELLLPDAPLRPLLAADTIGPDSPLGVLSADFAQRWPADVLAAAGVLRTFVVLTADDPTGPDHDLADEADWWAWIEGDEQPPATLVGVRDLDLIDDDAWPAAIRLLAGEPVIRRAMADPRSYPAWWLARCANLAGRPPLDWRLASAERLAGLFDPVPAEIDLPAELLLVVGVRDRLVVDDAEDATDLLDRLGDADREVGVGLAMRVHAELVDAVVSGRLDPADVDPPERVRVISGQTIAAEDAVVLDRPWLVVAGEDRIVAAADGDEKLADLLNVSLASEVVTAEPEADGDELAWAELGAVRLACALLGIDVPAGSVAVHEQLHVGGHRVSWWVEEDLVHAEDTPEGLGRALAWTLRRWADRWLLAGVLTEPTAATILS